MLQVSSWQASWTLYSFIASPHFVSFCVSIFIYCVVIFIFYFKQDTDSEHSKLKEQREGLIKQMDALKAVLYAKFGKQINLENAEQTRED